LFTLQRWSNAFKKLLLIFYCCFWGAWDIRCAVASLLNIKICVKWLIKAIMKLEVVGEKSMWAGTNQVCLALIGSQHSSMILRLIFNFPLVYIYTLYIYQYLQFTLYWGILDKLDIHNICNGNMKSMSTHQKIVLLKLMHNKHYTSFRKTVFLIKCAFKKSMHLAELSTGWVLT